MEGALLTLLSLGSYSRLNVGHVEPITPFTILLQRPPLLGVSVPLHGLELNLTNPFTSPLSFFLHSLHPWKPFGFDIFSFCPASHYGSSLSLY